MIAAEVDFPDDFPPMGRQYGLAWVYDDTLLKLFAMLAIGTDFATIDDDGRWTSATNPTLATWLNIYFGDDYRPTVFYMGALRRSHLVARDVAWFCGATVVEYLPPSTGAKHDPRIIH